MSRLVSVLAVVALVGCGDDGGGGSADAGDGDGGSGPQTVTVTTYTGNQPTNATFVAYQDGDGEWSVAEGTGGVYELTIESGRYSVFLACHNDVPTIGNREVIIRATVAEVPNLPWGCASDSTQGTVSGTVAGLVTGDTAAVRFLSVSRTESEGNPNYEFSAFAQIADLVAIRSNGDSIVDVVTARDVNAASNPTVELDFGSAVAPNTYVTTATNAIGGEDVVSYSTLFTENGTRVGFPTVLGMEPWPTVPGSLLEDGDLIIATVEAPGAEIGRGAIRQMASPANVTVALVDPEDPAAAELSADAPYSRPTVTWNRSDDDRVYFSRWQWHDYTTPGWLDLAGTNSVETPDLSGLPGWDAAYEPAAGIVNLTFFRYMSSATVAQVLAGLTMARDALPPTPDADGVEYHWVIERQELTP